MTASFTDLIDYLSLTGWRRDSSRRSGSVWRRAGSCGPEVASGRSTAEDACHRQSHRADFPLPRPARGHID